MDEHLVGKRILAGERYLLGLGWVSQDDWNWHRAFPLESDWPFIASNSIDYRKPGTEIRLCWEINRFHDIYALARSFFVSKDESYVRGIERLLQDWTYQNPVGMGPNWVSAMEAAIRIVNLTWSMPLLEDCLNTVLLRDVGVILHQHLSFLERSLSHGSSANNHAIVERMGLVCGYAFWTDDPTQLESQLQHFTNVIAKQLHKSGLHKEMSTHYHLFVAEAAAHVRTAAMAHGIATPTLDDCIARMQTVIDALTTDHGLCRFGDDDDGVILRFYDDRYKWDLVLSGRTDNPWIRVPKRQPTATDGVADFDGILGIQCGRWRVVIDSAPHGLPPLYAHAHDDDMSVSIALDGRWIVTDTGTYGYYADRAARLHFCANASHNGPLVNGDGTTVQSMTGPFMWSRVPARSTAMVTRDGDNRICVSLAKRHANGHTLTRTVRCSPEAIDLMDSTDSQRPFSSSFSFAPVWTISHVRAQQLLLSSSAQSVSMSIFKGSPTVQTSPYSAVFGERTMTSAVAVIAENGVSIQFRLEHVEGGQRNRG